MLSPLIAVLIQVVFIVLYFWPRSGFGVPGPGFIFFLPSMALVSLSRLTGGLFVAAVLASQVVLTCFPVFWIVTRDRRSTRATLLRLSNFLILVVVVTPALTRLEKRQAIRAQATQAAGSNQVVNSIYYLNRALALFKAKYGEYPKDLDQLNFPEDSPVDSRHAGLMRLPMPMEEFFTFTYTGRKADGTTFSAYELSVDAKGRWWSELDHYCTDETGVIRFDTSVDRCKHGPVVLPRH